MGVRFLYNSCRETWPKSVCASANVCGYISTTIWFLVLFPQIWKNCKRRSVEGLSILWATANFTGSLVNAFFAFPIVSLPLYIKISAVYMPVLEFSILIQFCVYSKHPVQKKFYYGLVCFLFWAAIITVEVSVKNAAGNVQWIAIVLWSIESFPQVILNMQVRTTSGQATPSVVLGLMGKTTDFLAGYLLLLPPQYVVMTYFSSTLAYINGFQVIWYPKPQPKMAAIIRTPYVSHSNPDEDALEANDCDEQRLLSGGDPEGPVEVDRASEEEMASVCTAVRPNLEFRARIHDIPTYQLCFVGYILLTLVAFSVCICINTESAWGIFAPIVVAVVLFGAVLYRNLREGRMHFADSLLAWLDSCCSDQPVESTWVTHEQTDDR